jgi:hypothetical protein
LNLDITSTIDEDKIKKGLYTFAWVQLICAASLNFYEGPKMRRFSTLFLIGNLIIVDTLLIHFPKSTHEPMIYANELMQCTANIAIVGGLLMIMGLRDQPRRLV